MFVQQLPWLLLSLVSGAIVDRVDRRCLNMVADACRGMVLGRVTSVYFLMARQLSHVARDAERAAV